MMVRGFVTPGGWLWILALLLAAPAVAGPIALHPDNPRYFLFRGKPTFLITSGEHYGAVVNRDFDAIPYLDELASRGFNLTRVFSGVYREVPGSFNIRENTLAPAPGRYIAPWARSKTPGDADGGAKFDLDTWDDAYFQRLKDFCAQASKRGIVVEFVLFCPFYEDSLWNANPMNARNNVNAVGAVPREEVYTLKHRDLVARHEAFVRKVAAELKEYDNLYYEICNEPYFGGVTLEWQTRIAAVLEGLEPDPNSRHMIAMNIANGSAKIEHPLPAVSLFNFHYATPPDVIGVNAGLAKAIGDDETGFRGTGDRAYRTEGWAFLLAGGSLYDNLDYSFTTSRENGTAKVSDPTPGGGGPALRAQLAILKRFLESFDFVKMAPDRRFIARLAPESLAKNAHALAEPGKAYALYLDAGTQVELTLEIPKGRYRAEWLNPRTGAVDKTQEIEHGGGQVMLASPAYSEDIALRLVARR